MYSPLIQPAVVTWAKTQRRTSRWLRCEKVSLLVPVGSMISIITPCNTANFPSTLKNPAHHPHKSSVESYPLPRCYQHPAGEALWLFTYLPSQSILIRPKLVPWELDLGLPSARVKKH